MVANRLLIIFSTGLKVIRDFVKTMGYETELIGEFEISPKMTDDDRIVLEKENGIRPWKISTEGDKIIGEFSRGDYKAAIERTVEFLGKMGYQVDGIVDWKGDRPDDRGTIKIVKNQIEVEELAYDTGIGELA